MDFKGITWVGNVYQKFEAMCLEVEEIIVQDTAKYVENQVQTVGASVKKFYSDVVQDLLPPSSMDPVKGAAASELPEEQYAAVCNFEKKTAGMNEEDLKLDNEKLTEDSKVNTPIYKKASHAPNFHGLHGGDDTFQPSFRNSAMGACSDLYSTQYNHGGIYKKSNLCVKRISRKDNVPPTVISGTVTHMEIDLCRASTSCNLSDKDHESSCDQKTITSTPVSVEVSRCDFIEQSCNGIENESACIPGVSTDHSSSHMITLIESIGNNDLEMCHSNSGRLSVESNDICMNDEVVSQAGSSMNVDLQHNEFPDKVVLVSHPGHSDEWTTDTMKRSTVVEQGRESIQHLSEVRVEESCIIVNRDELHFVSNKEGKCRPYKKKIQDAISSRMRSARKQEHEQLAVQWYGDDAKSHQESVESPMPILTMANTKRSPTHDICESEWELL